MKIKLLLLFATTLFATHFASAQHLEWASAITGNQSEAAIFTTTDHLGNVYTVGQFAFDTDLDPGPDSLMVTSLGGADAFLTKLDANGNLVWARQFGGIGGDDAYSVAVDSAGNVHVVGHFRNTIEFEPGTGNFDLTAVGENDAYAVKLDVNGAVLWAKAFGGTDVENGFSVGLDADANVYVAGGLRGTGDFDPGAGTHMLTSEGLQDGFIVKLDAAGDFVWAAQLGSAGAERIYAIAVDDAGNIYATGNFSDPLDFDPGVGTLILTPDGPTDVFALKLNSASELIWAKHMGGPDSDLGFAIATDSDGNVFLAGDFDGGGDFDPGPGVQTLISEGSFDAFAAKLDPNGDFVWAHSWGSTGFDAANGIAVDAQGNAVVGGMFGGACDFDPGAGTTQLTAQGAFDVFVSQLQPNGDFNWVSDVTGAGQNFANSVAVNATGDIFVAGSFSNTADFDASANTFDLMADGEDAFTMKLNTCAASVSVSVEQTTLTAVSTSTNFQWLDCNNDNEPINGATTANYLATANGSFAVAVSEGGCADTSDCYIIVGIGIAEIQPSLELQAFPNPNNGAFTLDLGTTLPHASITLSDPLGRIIYRTSVANTQFVALELPGTNGVYILRAETQDAPAFFLKVMKQ